MSDSERNHTFELVDSGWDKLLTDNLRAEHSSLRIVCPFIKHSAARRLIASGRPQPLQVITRFDLRDIANGVSDVSALRLLLENGAQIRGVKNLHAKLYLLGDTRAIVTSANLTEAALLRNHEFGFFATDSAIVSQCRAYFDRLWARAGADLTGSRLDEWDSKITACLVGGGKRKVLLGLGDEGVDASLPPVRSVPPARVAHSEQAFVKFFGEGNNRAGRFTTVLEEVEGSGSHWACTYPRGKRPRQVQDGAVMFMGRLAKDPNDVLIYGRAIAIQHVPGRDDATEAEIKLRDWKKKWPHYVRVHHAEFVDGMLTNGISLKELMRHWGSKSFAATARNAAREAGNIEPQRAYMRQPSVELTTESAAWLNEQLDGAFALHGKITPAALEELDWPETQAVAAGAR